MTGRTVLVTGAAGLVGAEVTARLAADDDVIALVHNTAQLVRNNGRFLPVKAFDGLTTPGTISTLAGDVTAPRLGLDAGTARWLGRRVDLIVHSAAITDFGLPDEVYQRINVDGTAAVLEFAARAGAPLVHVSTAYVCGRRDGEILESELDAGHGFANAYERSKFAAERLVHQARESGVRSAIVRPGIVTGSERGGVVRDFKNIYLLLKLTTEGKLRTLPGRYDAAPALVPVDYVADVIAAVAARFEDAAGATFHAVGDSRLDLRAISDVLAEYPSFEVATYVPPAGFDAGALPAAERAYYDRVGRLYADYFERRPRFNDSATRRLLGGRTVRTGPAYLRKVLDYALRKGFLGDPLPSVDEVLARLAGVGAR
jgi:thioester reductase-like protein